MFPCVVLWLYAAHVISATSLQCVTQLLPCAHMITSSTPNSPTPYSNIAVSSPDPCLQSGDETNSNNVAQLSGILCNLSNTEPFSITSQATELLPQYIIRCALLRVQCNVNTSYPTINYVCYKHHNLHAL